MMCLSCPLVFTSPKLILKPSVNPVCDNTSLRSPKYDGCWLVFSFRSSKSHLLTSEEAESCHGNMMLLSVSFSCFYPLCMSHPYQLLSRFLARGLVLVSCRVAHKTRKAPRKTTASQRKILPFTQKKKMKKVHTIIKKKKNKSSACQGDLKLHLPSLECRDERIFKGS